eukprot:8950101-Lingulodinium_polyedra.AAC.1
MIRHGQLVALVGTAPSWEDKKVNNNLNSCKNMSVQLMKKCIVDFSNNMVTPTLLQQLLHKNRKNQWRLYMLGTAAKHDTPVAPGSTNKQVHHFNGAMIKAAGDRFNWLELEDGDVNWAKSGHYQMSLDDQHLLNIKHRFSGTVATNLVSQLLSIKHKFSGTCAQKRCMCLEFLISLISLISLPAEVKLSAQDSAKQWVVVEPWDEQCCKLESQDGCNVINVVRCFPDQSIFDYSNRLLLAMRSIGNMPALEAPPQAAKAPCTPKALEAPPQALALEDGWTSAPGTPGVTSSGAPPLAGTPSPGTPAAALTPLVGSAADKFQAPPSKVRRTIDNLAVRSS